MKRSNFRPKYLSVVKIIIVATKDSFRNFGISEYRPELPRFARSTILVIKPKLILK